MGSLNNLPEKLEFVLIFEQNNAMYKSVLLLLALLVFGSCQGQTQQNQATEKKSYAVQKTEAEWQALLSPLAYNVLRKAGTERAFSGAYYKNEASGTYVCAGCEAPLYESVHKFDSGTGWPSFDRGIYKNLEYDVDYKLGYGRTELKCAQCGGHLGHMFDDGPRNTTGKRHCINSIALRFIAQE